MPVKSMARCRGVSKLWSSIIRLPNYNHLFPDKSTYQPRFLFTFVVEESLLFFSLPQPDQLESVNLSLVATHHLTISVKDYSKLCPPVQGLVCSQLTGSDCDYTWALIVNPITGESVTTPKVPMKGMEAEMYFGFDPIDEMFKVLCNLGG
ncbi:unnamed protein product [Arabis nemorensis]|uniref:F-box associated beta-propeller type 3 domain-containing protein n=1 Tax=Arabis nemorensis TaxID=586526 RepID=A0A565CDM7_9BRAS|nr:unnamed protein product [Arabis nemorensis]